MILDKELLDNLTEYAKENERLRFAYDLRTTPQDQSQRILNALEPGTFLPIHRHRASSETVVIIRGRLIERFYDNNGNLIHEILMEPNGDNPIVQIDKDVWHSLISLESGTIIFEAKDGPYKPLAPDELFENASNSR